MKKIIAGVVAGAVVIAVGIVTLTGKTPSIQTGSITKTYSSGECGNGTCWTCKSEIALDTVIINIDTNIDREDAIKFAPGCTGTIHNIIVTTSSADAIKVAEGAHDIIVEGGDIQCQDKVPVVHQDGIQIMGGTNILFRSMTINCGRENDPLIDSNIFFNQGLNSTVPPTNVVCDSCYLGPWAAHTVNLEASDSSGVKNSVICPGKFHNLTFTIGPDAVNPVNEGNTLPDSC